MPSGVIVVTVTGTKYPFGEALPATAKPYTVAKSANTPTAATSHFWSIASLSRNDAPIATTPRMTWITFSPLSR